MQDRSSDMALVLENLKNYLTRARAKVASSWDLFSREDWWDASTGVKDDQLNALDSFGAHIIRLDAARAQVQAGSRSFASWASWAADIRSGVAQIIADTSNWEMTAILGDTIAATYDDVGDSIKVGSAIALPVIALVAVAVILISLRR